MSNNLFIGVVLISLAVVAYRQYKTENTLFISPHPLVGVLLVYAMLAVVGLAAPPVAAALGVAVLVAVVLNLYGRSDSTTLSEARALGVNPPSKQTGGKAA
jgi:FtsH-binding integral membrane protein